MSRPKFAPMENVNQFRQILLLTLAKFADPHTIKYASEEVREIMSEHVTNMERMNVFLYHLSDFNPSMKLLQRKEHMKLMGAIGEIFEEKCLPLMPKIVNFYAKRIKDSDPSLHQTLSEGLGSIIHYSFGKLGEEEMQDQLAPILRLLYHNIATANKVQ